MSSDAVISARVVSVTLEPLPNGRLEVHVDQSAPSASINSGYWLLAADAIIGEFMESNTDRLTPIESASLQGARELLVGLVQNGIARLNDALAEEEFRAGIPEKEPDPVD